MPTAKKKAPAKAAKKAMKKAPAKKAMKKAPAKKTMKPMAPAMPADAGSSEAPM